MVQSIRIPPFRQRIYTPSCTHLSCALIPYVFIFKLYILNLDTAHHFPAIVFLPLAFELWPFFLHRPGESRRRGRSRSR